MADRIGLFGGSFNPIHHGHLIIARSLHEQLGLSRTLVLPSRQPPHKEPNALAEPHHRAAMVQLAISGESTMAFDDFDLSREGPCYTIDTIEHFRARFPEASLFWFIGSDSLMDLPTWRRARELVQSCTMVTAARSGQPFNPAPLENAFGLALARDLLRFVLPTPVIDISSTDIRSRVAADRSIRFLVPEPVRDYIDKNRLYRSPDQTRPGSPNSPLRVC